MRLQTTVSIGFIAKRSGLAVSAVRYYESEGLIRAERNAGGHRRFLRADIRRVSFIMIAQKLGYSLDHIRQLLATLPQGRTPTKADWTRLSSRMRTDLDARIAHLVNLRDRLDGCIGCGCLSLDVCKLYNPDDQDAAQGPGPRKIMP